MKFEPLASQEAEKINRQAGMELVTDQDHWESMGITTGEELALEILTQTYSDTYKEIHGIRPRRQFDSPEEAREALEALYDHDLDSGLGDDETESLDPDYLDLPSFEGMGRRHSRRYAEGIETVRAIIAEELTRLRVQESPAAIAAVLAGHEMGAPKNRKPAAAPFGGYSMGVKQRRKTEEEIIDALKDASLSLDGIESDRLNTGMLMGLTDAQLEALARRVHEPTWLQKLARKVGVKNIKKR